nr:hypothetical protein Iba_chr11aCG6590 [Ipomoea batatas]
MHWKGLLIPAAAKKARTICSSQTKRLRSLSTSFNENGPRYFSENNKDPVAGTSIVKATVLGFMAVMKV